MTVILQSTAEVSGIVLPSSSVSAPKAACPSCGSRREPERFEPRTVRYEPLDGAARVTLLAGLKPEERVVTEGATLLNQIR